MSVIDVDRYRATHRLVAAAIMVEELLGAEQSTLTIETIEGLTLRGRLEGIGRRRELVVSVWWQQTGLPLCAAGVRLRRPDQDVLRQSGPSEAVLDIEGRCRLPAAFAVHGAELELRLIDPDEAVFGGVPAPPRLLTQRAAGVMTPMRPARAEPDGRFPELPDGRWGRLIGALLAEDAGMTYAAQLRRLVCQEAERPNREVPEQVWRHLEAHTSRRGHDAQSKVWQRAVLAHADLVWARAAYTSPSSNEHVHQQMAKFEITDAYERAATLDAAWVLQEAVLRLHAAGELSADALAELSQPSLPRDDAEALPPLEAQFSPLTVALRQAETDSEALLEVRTGGGPGLSHDLAVVAHPEQQREPLLVPLSSSTAPYADPSRLRGAVRISIERLQPLDYLPHPRVSVEAIPRAAARQVRASFDAADEDTRAAWAALAQLPRAVRWLREVIATADLDLAKQP